MKDKREMHVLNQSIYCKFKNYHHCYNHSHFYRHWPQPEVFQYPISSIRPCLYIREKSWQRVVRLK